VKPTAALRKKEQQNFAEQHLDSRCSFKFSLPTSHPALDARARELLCHFAWEKTVADRARIDMRMVVLRAAFLQLLEEKETESRAEGPAAASSRAERVLRELKRLSPDIPGTPKGDSEYKIALRMTRGPTNACIDFHCDGYAHASLAKAAGTVQVALNDQGGRLCFFVMKPNEKDDELVVLKRPAGLVCQHGSKVLHGVTALLSGTRKILFVVDHTNGLGEDGVATASCSDVTLFLEDTALKAAKRETDMARQEAKEAQRRARGTLDVLAKIEERDERAITDVLLAAAMETLDWHVAAR
jgi:hypothetical protein